jgi:hypothetical protein
LSLFPPCLPPCLSYYYPSPVTCLSFLPVCHRACLFPTLPCNLSLFSPCLPSCLSYSYPSLVVCLSVLSIFYHACLIPILPL